MNLITSTEEQPKKIVAQIMLKGYCDDHPISHYEKVSLNHHCHSESTPRHSSVHSLSKFVKGEAICFLMVLSRLFVGPLGW